MQGQDKIERKKLLGISKSKNSVLVELLKIRGDYVSVNENINIFSEMDRGRKLMRMKECGLVISEYKNEELCFGRIYNSEFLDLIRFKILKSAGYKQFKKVPAELFVKYLFLIQNVTNKRMENLFIDIFRQRTLKINIEGVKYAWIINVSGRVYTLKYVRILSDNTVDDIGPFFELELLEEYYSSDDLFEKALEISSNTSKIKNIEKTPFKDTVGKLHISKQDLKDIKLRYHGKKISSGKEDEME